MHTRKLIVVLMALSVCTALTGFALAAKPKGPDPGILNGTVVSVEKIKLTLMTQDGKQETLEAADSCSVRIDGKEAKLGDLTKDMKIVYTKNPDGKLGSVRVGA